MEEGGEYIQSSKRKKYSNVYVYIAIKKINFVVNNKRRNLFAQMLEFLNENSNVRKFEI